jgi:hypothetical protein
MFGSLCEATLATHSRGTRRLCLAQSARPTACIALRQIRDEVSEAKAVVPRHESQELHTLACSHPAHSHPSTTYDCQTQVSPPLCFVTSSSQVLLSNQTCSSHTNAYLGAWAGLRSKPIHSPSSMLLSTRNRLLVIDRFSVCCRKK